MADISNPQRLNGITLFSGLSPEAIAEIEALCVWHRFAEGEQVFDQEHKGRDVFFLAAGAVRVLTYTQTRREVALANVLAGDYFGELAAIDGKGRSARVIAVEDSLIASLPGQTFMDLMYKYPSIGVGLINRFAFIIRVLNARVTDLSTLTENQRVLAELVRIAKPDPKRPGIWLISSLPNHKEIASWAGTTRDVVAQTIGELARDGVVERRTMGLLIKDWGRLQLMARV
ncbi:MAG: Crp/Fnr family transcriptional regulator [Alphaproteobacteria bacterium]